MDGKVIQGLMNPIRMKMILTMMKKGKATTKELASELSGIPQASLYRHINFLLKADILEVIESNKVRGTLERTLRVKGNPMADLEHFGATATPEQMNELYYIFTMTQLAQFGEYILHPDADPIPDRMGFRSFPLYMNDEECDAFNAEFGQMILKYINNPGEGQRRLRHLSFTFIPTDLTEE